jgi:hypothetical protein
MCSVTPSICNVVSDFHRLGENISLAVAYYA